MLNYLHKYLIAISFARGKKTALYFSRFALRMQKSLPIILRLAIIALRFFNLASRFLHSLHIGRFWLLVLYHFLVIYEVIFLLRIAIEYSFINPHTSNKPIKTIYDLSEPYFKLVQSYLPRNFLGTILGLYLLNFLVSFMPKICRLYPLYFTGLDEAFEVEILSLVAFQEKLVLN